MVSSKSLKVFIAGMFALASLVVIADPVAAQDQPTIQVDVGTFDGPIRPLSETKETTITIKYTYFGAAGASGLVPVRVALQVADLPPWAVATLNPPAVFMTITPTQQATTVQQTAKLLMATTADAPGLTPVTIKIKATSDSNSYLKSANSEGQTTISADYFGLLDAVAGTTIQIAKPQEQVSYPITVTNLGNGQTKVFFRITNAPEGWQVVTPQPVVLEARQQGGKKTSETIQLQIQTPFRNGYLNEVGVVGLEITSAYALNPDKKGDTTQVNVLTTTKGFYVPGFDGLTMSLSVLGVALLVGMRRKFA